MGLLAILSWSISFPISSSASSSLLADYPAFLGMVSTLPQGDIAPPVITPNAGVGLRLFLTIDGKNYGLDLPQRLIPAYRRFLGSVGSNTARAPFNLTTTLSLEAKDNLWVFSIHKA